MRLEDFGKSGVLKYDGIAVDWNEVDDPQYEWVICLPSGDYFKVEAMDADAVREWMKANNYIEHDGVWGYVALDSYWRKPGDADKEVWGE